MLNCVSGGLGGQQVESNIIDAIGDLATNYHSDDEIIVIGYSRGETLEQPSV